MSALDLYELTPRALRDIRHLDVVTRQRILDALDRFIEDPRPADVKKVRGEHDEWRLRVGDWRVRFRRDDVRRIMVVTRILPRSVAYRD